MSNNIKEHIYISNIIIFKIIFNKFLSLKVRK